MVATDGSGCSRRFSTSQRDVSPAAATGWRDLVEEKSVFEHLSEYSHIGFAAATGVAAMKRARLPAASDLDAIVLGGADTELRPVVIKLAMRWIRKRRGQ